MDKSLILTASRRSYSAWHIGTGILKAQNVISSSGDLKANWVMLGCFNILNSIVTYFKQLIIKTISNLINHIVFISTAL